MLLWTFKYGIATYALDFLLASNVTSTMVVTSWTFKGPTFVRNCWTCPWCGTSYAHNFGDINCSNTRVCNLLTFEHAVAPSGMSITSQPSCNIKSLSRSDFHYKRVMPCLAETGHCLWILLRKCVKTSPADFDKTSLYPYVWWRIFFRLRFQSVMACPFGMANPIESSLFLRIFNLSICRYWHVVPTKACGIFLRQREETGTIEEQGHVTGWIWMAYFPTVKIQLISKHPDTQQQ